MVALTVSGDLSKIDLCVYDFSELIMKGTR